MLSDTKRDLVIVGGGILGLATAFRVMEARPNTRLTLVEKESSIARHQTGNNSGVIHSGLYYKPGSQKAINCLNGYRQLLEFCKRENIPHEICGKIVVATSVAEIARLEELHRRGIANGLEGLKFLTPEEIQEIEPYCSGVRGLFVPQTGIIDYVAVSKSYCGKLLDMGVEIICGERVVNIRRVGDKVEVLGETRSWKARAAVTCAGLQSDRMARNTNPNLPLRILPFRGEYYQLKASARHLVKNLIYPVPDPAFPFLGVHFTRMIGGGVECGPNAVFALGREAYRKSDINLGDMYDAFCWPGFWKVASKYWRNGLEEYHRSLSKHAFVSALQKLLPEINSEDIEPCGAGIRAQACDRDGKLLDDFDFCFDDNLVHVCNAPSPAATASLSIGQTIAGKVLPILN